MVVYKITNIITGKVYIGQTTRDFKLRVNQHLYAAKDGNGKLLYRDMRKYGEENFKFEVIKEANSKEGLNEIEAFYITEYKKDFNSYNISNKKLPNSKRVQFAIHFRNREERNTFKKILNELLKKLGMSSFDTVLVALKEYEKQFRTN